jgi:hypothetical protein
MAADPKAIAKQFLDAFAGFCFCASCSRGAAALLLR